MLKRVLLFTLMLAVVFSFSACDTNIKLFKTKNIKEILMTDSKVTIRLTEDEQDAFVERYGKICLATDVAGEQDHGHHNVGEQIFAFQVTNESGNRETFVFVKTFVEGSDVADYYFEKSIRGLYYLSKRLNEEDNEWLSELMFGDIIILD